MLQTVEGSFRTPEGTSGIVNLADWIAPVSGGRTLGATLVDQTPAIGPMTVKAPVPTLLGYSISAGLYLDSWNRAGAPGPAFGQFGAIRAVLSRYASITRPGTAAQTFGGFYASQALPLPTDSLGSGVTLWDPAADDLPPAYNLVQGSPSVLPIAGDRELAQPVPLERGQRLYIGIWITPSLLAVGATPFAGVTSPCMVPTVVSGQYQIRYDDGVSR